MTDATTSEASPTPEITLPQFKKALTQRISSYQERYKSDQDRLKRREDNINELNTLIKDAGNKNQLRKNLLSYFNDSDKYKKNNNSALENSLLDYLYASLIPEEKNTLNYTDTSIKITYELKDYIDFALDKYKEEKGSDLLDYRKKSCEDIQAILNKDSNSNEKIDHIKKYLTQETPYNHSGSLYFEKPFSSTLKAYLFNAIEQYTADNNYHGNKNINNHSRAFCTRTWEAANTTEAKPKKILLFIHGRYGSKDTANFIAPLAQEEGFTIITYDHRGHGEDREREKPSDQTLSADLFRIDFRKFLEDVATKNPDAEITLVGHSLGGAMLASENQFINKFTWDNTQGEKSQIKSVTLLSPAISEYIVPLILYLINNILLLLGLHSLLIFPAEYPEITAHFKAETKRNGKLGAKTFSLYNLLFFMRTAFHSLERFFLQSVETPSSVPWRIHSSTPDNFLLGDETQKIIDRTNEAKKIKKTKEENTDKQIENNITTEINDSFRHNDWVMGRRCGSFWEKKLLPQLKEGTKTLSESSSSETEISDLIQGNSANTTANTTTPELLENNSSEIPTSYLPKNNPDQITTSPLTPPSPPQRPIRSIRELPDNKKTVPRIDSFNNILNPLTTTPSLGRPSSVIQFSSRNENDKTGSPSLMPESPDPRLYSSLFFINSIPPNPTNDPPPKTKACRSLSFP